MKMHTLSVQFWTLPQLILLFSFFSVAMLVLHSWSSK